jgi:hypothetical protein
MIFELTEDIIFSKRELPPRFGKNMTEHKISKNVTVIDMRPRGRGRPALNLQGITDDLRETINYLDSTDMICNVSVLSDSDFNVTLHSKKEPAKYLKAVNY